MDQPDVAAIAARAREAGRLGLDTEFMPEGRYRPLLCLVQIVVVEDVWVLDPLKGFESGPLAAVLADPDIEIVVHAGGSLSVAVAKLELAITGPQRAARLRQAQPPGAGAAQAVVQQRGGCQDDQ